MLVLFDIEVVEVEEAVEQRFVQALQTVEQGEIVRGAAEGRVAKWQKGRIRAAHERLVRFFGRTFQINDL